MEESAKLSAMINEAEAARVSDWLQEAVQGGARLITGGDREKAIVQPTVIADAASNPACDSPHKNCLVLQLGSHL